jgi:hypothetical protein
MPFRTQNSYTVHFHVTQNAQNKVRYVPYCDAEKGSDTEICDCISYHISYYPLTSLNASGRVI